MTSPAFLLIVPLLGVTFGYEPSSDAEVGYDYTVQVEPELLEQMKEGNAEAIEANIPPEVSPIRRIRVVVGTEPLAKKLRPGAVSRTTYRPDVDGAESPSIDLLAQTGTAGGWGRSASGFNGPATRASSQPNPTATSTPAAAPPAGNQYTGNQYPNNQYTVPPVTPTVTRSGASPEPSAYDPRTQLDAGFEAAQNGFDNTRNAVRNTLNEMGSTGERVINDSRQAMGDLISPPERNSLNSQQYAAPTSTVQDQFRSTTDAMRNSIDQATAAARDMYSTDRYGNPIGNAAGNVNSQPGMQPMVPIPGTDWTTDSAGNPLRVSDRSVLINRSNTSSNSSTQLTDAEREYWDRVDREQRERDAALAAQQRSQVPVNQGPGFPPKQFAETSPETGRDNTIERRSDVIDAMVVRGSSNSAARSPEPTLAAPAITAASNQGDGFADPFNRPLEGGNNTGGIANVTPTSQTTERANFDGFGNPAQQAGVADAAVEAAKSTGVPPAVWAWAIAVAMSLLNAFQWFNMVDLRNKYRVALRRSSPNFARSMAA